MKDRFLLQMAGLKNCYIFYVSIENCLLSCGYEDWVLCSETECFFIFFLIYHNVNFSKYIVKLKSNELDLDFNSISSIFTIMKILKIFKWRLIRHYIIILIYFNHFFFVLENIQKINKK